MIMVIALNTLASSQMAAKKLPVHKSEVSKFKVHFSSNRWPCNRCKLVYSPVLPVGLNKITSPMYMCMILVLLGTEVTGLHISNEKITSS